MKLSPSDYARFDAELKKANENSKEHTFNNPAELTSILAGADDRLEDLGITGKACEGARLEIISGKPVSEKYTFNRRATRVVAQRYPTGWFVTAIESTKIDYKGGGCTLILNPIQDELAVAAFRIRTYRTEL